MMALKHDQHSRVCFDEQLTACTIGTISALCLCAFLLKPRRSAVDSNRMQSIAVFCGQYQDLQHEEMVTKKKKKYGGVYTKEESVDGNKMKAFFVSPSFFRDSLAM